MLPLCRHFSTTHTAASSRSQLTRPYLNPRIYLVANRPSFTDENLFFSQVRKSVAGGVSCVQLRDLDSDFESTIKTASLLKKILRDTPLFVNTRHSIALCKAVGAQGIYIEHKFSYADARRLLGPRAIIGVPVMSQDEVEELNETQVDYISVKLAPSKKTSPINGTLWGLEGLQSVRNTSRHKIVAVGGVQLVQVEEIYKILGPCDGVAIAGALMDAENPTLIAQKIHAISQRIKGVS